MHDTGSIGSLLHVINAFIIDIYGVCRRSNRSFIHCVLPPSLGCHIERSHLRLHLILPYRCKFWLGNEKGGDLS